MGIGRMKAALLYGVGDLRVEEVDVPEVDRGEALVRVRAATTCGTDVKILRRGYISGVIHYPTVFGHEWAGDVVDVGEGVPWLERGMRVRAGNSAPCFRCGMCKKGRYNLCEDRTWLWGAYAEYVKISESILRVNTQEIPSHLSYEEAAVSEPLACCLHGIEECGVNVGDSVVIIGDGPIGLLLTQLARLQGAGKVIVCGHHGNRLEVARDVGADVTVEGEEEQAIREVERSTDGLGADVVIEAIGLPATWEEALKMVGKGGKVLFFGGCPPGTEVNIGTERLHYGELTLLGAFHANPAHFSKALRLIASGMVRVKPLITRRMSLDEIGEAFRLLATSKSELKVAITP